MTKIKVAIFEDNKSRRELLKILIENTEELCCTGAYQDCRNIVKNLEKNLPDVVLMDIDMPYVNGITGLQILKDKYPGVKVLIQTIFEDDEKIFDAIISGAEGYILKKISPDNLIQAITDIMHGGSPMTPTIARRILKLFVDKKKVSGKIKFDLSQRELELLSLLVKGFSYKMIAEQCKLSCGTVNTHLSSIYSKLQVKSSTAAVAKAIDANIVIQ